eukprot:4508011-Prymnesium_polylepis.1
MYECTAQEVVSSHGKVEQTTFVRDATVRGGGPTKRPYAIDPQLRQDSAIRIRGVTVGFVNSTPRDCAI